MAGLGARDAGLGEGTLDMGADAAENGVAVAPYNRGGALKRLTKS